MIAATKLSNDYSITVTTNNDVTNSESVYSQDNITNETSNPATTPANTQPDAKSIVQKDPSYVPRTARGLHYTYNGLL